MYWMFGKTLNVILQTVSVIRCPSKTDIFQYYDVCGEVVIDKDCQNEY